MKANKSVRKIGVDPSLALLRNSRSFRWYWAGQSLSFVGSQVSVVALPLVAALTLDAGPGGVSAVATAAMLPNLLFSLLVGNWVEGRDQRRIMVPADFLRAVLLATIPLAWAAGWLSLPWLIAVAFLAGVAGIFFEIAGFAYVPDLLRTARPGGVPAPRDWSGGADRCSAADLGSRVSGLGLGNANVYSLTLRQTVIPKALLARSGGAYRQIMFGSIPIGSALAGVIGEATGTRVGVAMGAAGLALSALPMFARRIRTLSTPSRAGSTSESAEVG